MTEIKISEIDWGIRARKEYKDIDSLAESMDKLGLINPITVEHPNKLRAGGRRLTAAISLNWDSIPCIFFEDLSDEEKLEVELHENIQRNDLTWQEEIQLKEKLDTLKKKQARKEGKKWTQDDTAKVFGISAGEVGKQLALAKAIKNSPELLEEKDKHKALTKMRRKHDDVKRSLEAATSQTSDTIYHGDAIQEMKKIPDNSIDLFLFDPPFAEGYDKKAGNAGWDKAYGAVEDTEDIIYPLVSGVLKEAYRVLKEGAHGYMFFSIRPHKYEILANLISLNNLKYQDQPLFWVKPSNQNFQPYHRFTVNYEPFFFIWKGGKPRDLSEQHNATFEWPLENKEHPAQKPTGLYGELIRISSREGETVLDPTAGSGMALVAAKALERKVIGIEFEEKWYNLIKVNLSKVKGGG